MRGNSDSKRRRKQLKRLRKSKKRLSQMERLEPRMLLASDLRLHPAFAPDSVSPDWGQPLPDSSHGDALMRSEPALVSAVGGRVTPQATSSELVVVDGGIESHQAFVDALGLRSGVDGRHFEILVLDAERDGIEQVSDTLRGRRGINAVHILSHGSRGGIQLGKSQLDHASLSSYAGELANWSSSLSADADILLYGCNVADSQLGIEFVDRLSVVTGADVAASVTGLAVAGSL